MATLAEIICSKREETITISYNSAVEQIKSLVESDPFQAHFIISAGCTSEAMTNEIAKRFNVGNVKATVVQGGVVKTGWSIKIHCPLYTYEY